MMKTRIYSLATLLLCLAVLTSCVKTDDVVENTSSLWYHNAGNLVEISGDETKAEMQITSDCAWQIETENGSWLSVQPQQGNGTQRVTVTADGTNPSTTEARRSQLVLVTKDGVRKRIEVVQGPSTVVVPPAPVLEATPASMVIGAIEVGTQQITITSNIEWEIHCDADWVHLSTLSGTADATVSLSFDDNASLSPRTTTVTISDKWTADDNREAAPNRIVTIQQDGGHLQVMGSTTVDDVDETEAHVSGVVTYTEFPITEYGFCIGTTENLAETGERHILSGTPQTGTPFVATLTGLTKKTHYFVCAYATTTLGTVYGTVADFETLSIPKEGDLNKPNH